VSDQGNVYGQLARSLDALTIGNAEATEDREARDRVLQGTDMTQNIQIPVSGVAWREPVWTQIEVSWAYPFLNRIDRSRTDSDLEDPHFNYGCELQSDANVIIMAQIRDWIEDPETGWLIGAQVRVCAWCPQGRKKHSWTGKIHMSFTGYGAPSEDESGL
jgi:hypothetical protein